MSEYTQEEIDKARQFLAAGGWFYYDTMDEVEETGDYHTEQEKHDVMQTLNQNDTWCWGSAFGQLVTDEQLPEVADYARRYGTGGTLYWTSKQNDDMASEFEDIQRKIDFVREEEKIVHGGDDYNARAYKQVMYTLGGPRCKRCWKHYPNEERYEFHPYEEHPDVVWAVCSECHKLP